MIGACREQRRSQKSWADSSPRRGSPEGPPPSDGTWAIHSPDSPSSPGPAAACTSSPRNCSCCWPSRPDSWCDLIRFAAAIDLDVGVIATLDPVGDPTRLPSDTVVWPCGAYGCCYGGCVPDQPCPALCTVESINGVPGAHHLIFGEPT